VRQGGRVLHSERFRELVPNRSIRLRGHWAGQAAPDSGPVVVSAKTRSSDGAAR